MAYATTMDTTISASWVVYHQEISLTTYLKTNNCDHNFYKSRLTKFVKTVRFVKVICLPEVPNVLLKKNLAFLTLYYLIVLLWVFLHKLGQMIFNWQLKFTGDSSGLSTESFVYRGQALTERTLGNNFILLCQSQSLWRKNPMMDFGVVTEQWVELRAGYMFSPSYIVCRYSYRL